MNCLLCNTFESQVPAVLTQGTTQKGKTLNLIQSGQAFICNVFQIYWVNPLSFTACYYCTQPPAFFKNISKFCTFLPKFSSILPFFCLFQHFFPFFWKITRVPLLSKRDHACINAYISKYLHIYHAHHTCHTIYTIYKFCKYISYIPYHAMHTYLYICICIFICTFIHRYHRYVTYLPNIANIDVIDTIDINTNHTIHYVTFVYVTYWKVSKKSLQGFLRRKMA